MKHEHPGAPLRSLRKKWQHVSIKWRIFSIFVVFTLFVLILLWLFQTVFLNQFYEATKKQEVRSSASVLAAGIDSDGFAELMKQEARRNQLCILVREMNGIYVHGYDASPNRLSEELGDEATSALLNFLYQNTKNEGGTHMELIHPQLSTTVWSLLFRSRGIVYSSIEQRADGTEYMLFLYSVITPLNATVNTIRSQLLLITGILLVLALLLALYLSKHISKPIIRINDTARELATGDYGVTFEGAGYREVNELSRTLNYAAQELGKVEGLQRELVANISHDLRTPLTMICGYAEVMRDLPGENTPENVQVIIDEASRLNSLVNDVLDISKFQSGTQKLEKTEFCLTDDIRNTLLRYRKMTDCILTFETDKDVTVLADELKISQVLYNLVNNAITYTGPDRRIYLRQTVRDGLVTVEVTDTGEGIPEEKLRDIWQRYYKVDQAHKRAQVGTGLGLSIVKTILDLHGGSYGVRSAEGVGSTFWFSLPVLAELPQGGDTELPD